MTLGLAVPDSIWAGFITSKTKYLRSILAGG